MSAINILPQEIYDKIAAGEVVERPASVVKELVENSIDAGATSISVEIEKGGTDFIRITDNGCGMSREDAQLCFIRHATSKIKSESDLDAIYTLGFRGEAMASIGAVSKIKLVTKRAEDEQGSAVYFCGGELISCTEAGAANGTTIVIRELFYNTPARMKFLKKDATEAGYISDIISRFILAHPEISFRLIKDSKEQYFTPGDNDIKNAVYAVYGRDYAKAAIDVDYTLDGIHVTGIAGKGEAARANRAYQSFFINKRYIKSGMIARAVEEAYKNQIMIGKFPTVALNIEIDPHEVDINVHPTKLEVKFSDEGRIYRAVYHAVKNAIYSLPHIPEIERKTEAPQAEAIIPNVLPKEASGWDTAKMPVQRGGFSSFERTLQPAAQPYRETKSDFSAISAAKQAPDDAPDTEKPAPAANTDSEFALFSQPPVSPDSGNTYKSFSADTAADGYFRRRQEEMSGIGDEPLAELRTKNEQVRGIDELPQSFKIIGQLFATYILVEQDDSLLLIDQHAAHERIKYEELKKQLAGRKITPQMLMIPVPVKLSPIEAAAFADHKDALDELGFEAESRSGEFFITAVPTPMDEDELCTLFCELLDELIENRTEIIGKTKERLTYTIACKAAIKANHAFSEVEMYELVRMVFALENINTCPHGRPIIIKMSKKEIEKEFGRTL